MVPSFSTIPLVTFIHSSIPPPFPNVRYNTRLFKDDKGGYVVRQAASEAKAEEDVEAESHNGASIKVRHSQTPSLDAGTWAGHSNVVFFPCRSCLAITAH